MLAHQIAGVPIASTSREQDATSQPYSPGADAGGVVVGHRPGQQQPAGRVRLVRVALAQAVVELELRHLVVPPRPQHVGGQAGQAGGGVRLRPVPVPGARSPPSSARNQPAQDSTYSAAGSTTSTASDVGAGRAGRSRAPASAARRCGARRPPRRRTAAPGRRRSTAPTTWSRRPRRGRRRRPGATSARRAAARGRSARRRARAPGGCGRRPGRRPGRRTRRAPRRRGRRRASPPGSARGAARPGRAAGPAVQPSTVEPVMRRVTRTSTTTISVPATAAAIRQPNSSTPNSRIPSAIAHLPSGGWTMKPGWPFGSHRIAAPGSASLLPTRRGLDAEAQEVLRVAGVVDLVEDPAPRDVEAHDPQQRRPRAPTASAASQPPRRSASVALGGRMRRSRQAAVRRGPSAAGPLERRGHGRHPRRAGPRLSHGVPLVLAGAPIGRADDASARLVAALAQRRRRRGRGHPAAAPAVRRPRRDRCAAGSSASSRATSASAPPACSTPCARARPSCSSPTPGCRPSPTPATGWSSPPRRPTCR